MTYYGHKMRRDYSLENTATVEEAKRKPGTA